MNVETTLRVAQAVCPSGSRDRRFEEWQADIAGCDELGISSAGVAVGALRLASAARVRLWVSLVSRLLVGLSTAIAGVLLGAVCGAFGIPVLVVVAVAVLLQGSTVAIARWKMRERRVQSHQIDTSR